MQCQQCGKDIADNSSFCPHCGERLRSSQPGGVTSAATTSPATSDAHTAAANRLGQDPTRFGSTAPPEEELWQGTFSPKAMVGPAIACGVVSLVALIGVLFGWPTAAGWIAFVVGLVLLWGTLGLTLLYRRLSIYYRLTRYRLFHERGLLARTTDRIETIDITDVTVHQGVIERIFGIGTIRIASGDRTTPTLPMPGIDRVQEVANLIDSARRAERQRRGLHLETT